jgi:hypothetical protein
MLCSCLTRMLSSHDKAISHLDGYDILEGGDKSDTGVGSGCRRRLIDRY